MLDAGERLKALHLFASASKEGPTDYNQKLSEPRLNAVRLKLKTFDQDLADRIEQLPEPHRLTAAEVQVAVAATSALTEDQIKSHAFGEEFNQTQVNPFDRRVFAVLQLEHEALLSGLERRAFFLVRTAPGRSYSDAPTASETAEAPLPPFDLPFGPSRS